MQAQRSPRRAYGTGTIFVHRDAWYGQWRVGGRLVKRKLGPLRKGGTTGLTRKQAEIKLRELMAAISDVSPATGMTVDEAGARYIAHLTTVMGRKPATVQDYAIMLRRHINPVFGSVRVERVTPANVTTFIESQLRAGLARQTVVNQLNFLHGIFQHAVRRGWSSRNPVQGVERPPSAGRTSDIRYLSPEEVEALVRATRDDVFGRTDAALYLTAALTGLRQGELAALRWQDVDWAAGVLRVRQSYTRGQFGSPKSRRGSRAVPMADRVAGALERHFAETPFQADADLVFGHPHTGSPYDASRMRKRFKATLRRAGVRDVRFHDLRHTFGTRMAAAGAPLRSLQEWMGHRDYATTALYADYAPDSSNGVRWAERAFAMPAAGPVGPEDGLMASVHGTTPEE